MNHPHASSMIDRLTAHQDRALDVTARAEAMLARDDRSLAGPLAQTRWELMRAMMPYSAFKHGELFPMMIASGAADKLGVATALRDDCLALGDEFKSYVTYWSSVSVADNWEQYRRATLAMIARLKAHVQRERRAVQSILMPGADRRVPHAPLSSMR